MYDDLTRRNVKASNYYRMKGTSSCAKMTTEHSYKVNTYDYCRRCIAPGR